MPPKKKEPNVQKNKIITFRLNMSEYEQLLSNMRSLDYLSKTKYIRACVLNKRHTIKTVKMTDRAIRNQINEISAKLSKIGTNYNQVVKHINTLATAKKKNGDPVINTMFLTYQLNHIEKMTIEIRDIMKEIISQVGNLQLDN